MSESTLPSLDDLAADDALLVHHKCHGFEAAWKSWQGGDRPVLENWLLDLPSMTVRSVLLGELLQLELEYRRKAGEQPVLDEYLARFSTDEALLQQMWSGTATGTLEPEEENHHTDSELEILRPAREPGSLGSLEHYEVHDVVGRGGMGIVLKARDTELDRIVAIKILAAHLKTNSVSRKHFVREAQAAAAICDPHVVTIHAVNDKGVLPYLVMEFIFGVTLEERVNRDGPLAVKEILRIGMQAAEGLAAAHRQGMIHRDVKPANILLENGIERVKIVDFGLARVNDQFNLTHPGIIAGTPAYMSPQQARCEVLDHRTDLFSLGCVLYFLCTGVPAFNATNMITVLKRVCEDKPTPIRRLNSEIPDWLAEIVNKLMAKEPKDRFQSAAELATLLRNHLSRLQHSDLMPSVWPGHSTVRRWLGITAACITGICLLSLLVYFISNRGDSPPNSTGLVAQQVRSDTTVLMVSQKKEDGGEFRTINDALKKVGEGRKTIRVLDDSVYKSRYELTTRKRSGMCYRVSGRQETNHPQAGRQTKLCMHSRCAWCQIAQVCASNQDPGKTILWLLSLVKFQESCSNASNSWANQKRQVTLASRWSSGNSLWPRTTNPLLFTIAQSMAQPMASYIDAMKLTPLRDMPQACYNILIRDNEITSCGNWHQHYRCSRSHPYRKQHLLALS